MTMPFGAGPREAMMADLEAGMGPDMRIPKSQVNYREATTEDMSCGACAQFIEGESVCRVVEGQVSAAGVCDQFEPGAAGDGSGEGMLDEGVL